MAEGSSNNSDGGSGFMTGLLIGGLAGFVAGILLAPKSGEETRAMIMDRGQEWRDKADELTASTKERLASATTEGRRAADLIRGDSQFDELDLDDDDL